MNPDPLATLAELEGVPSAIVGARDAVDAVLRDRGVRRVPADVAAEALLRSSWASAALEGSSATLVDVRAGPTDPLAQGALRLSTELLSLTPMLRRTPGQAVARMHALAAGPSMGGRESGAGGRTSECASDSASGSGGADQGGAGAGTDALGRPRRTGDPGPPDPLGLGAAPDAEEANVRLRGVLGAASGSSAPAVVVAAVAHAEIAAARPFVVGSGIVARAVSRLLLVGRGVDPPSITVPEEVHLGAGAAYAQALTSYTSGTSAGVSAWIRHYTEAVRDGAGLALQAETEG